MKARNTLVRFGAWLCILVGSVAAAWGHSAVDPVPRDDQRWRDRHQRLNQRATEVGAQAQVIFIGDSITEGWEGAGKEVWAKYYAHRHALNLGISGDRTQHVLWRLDHGNLDDLQPKAAVVLIGTNNSDGADNTAEQIADGVSAVVRKLAERLPDTKVLLMAILPRGENPQPQRGKLLEVNQLLQKLGDNDRVTYVDIGHRFLTPDARITADLMPDYLHLSPKGYGIWAASIEGLLSRILGDTPVKPDLPGSVVSAPPGRLARWGFNEAGFGSDDGRAPLVTRGLTAVPSLDGLAPSFGRSNQTSLLQFAAVADGGRTNLSYPLGSIRLLYRPAWSSRQPAAGPEYAWGRGPGAWARLLTVVEQEGDRTTPLLSLAVAPEGTNLVLEARGRDGVYRTNFDATIRWLRAQPDLNPDLPWPWHEIAVAWSPTNTYVFVDGMQMQDWPSRQYAGPGVFQPARPLTNLAFSLGTDANGDGPVNGLMDEVETFNRTISLQDLYHLRDSAALSATVDTSPLAVTLRWVSLSDQPVTVRRRLTTETNWVTLTNRWVGFSWVDRDPALRLGATYEYEVGRRSMWVALEARPVERRGRAILLVDEAVAGRLANELEQLRSDLVGDGWTVLRHDVPRHDDNAWAREAVNPKYISDLRRVKSFIETAYAAAPNEPHAAILIGHVTVPYAGIAYEDGHFDRNGSWPADSYYGDMDGEWSDQVVNTGTNIADPLRRNVPGDGKLDAFMFDRYIRTPSGQHGVEVAVGRIDFSRLPAFEPSGEIELLRRYLRKDHAYRQAQVRFEPIVCGGAFFWSVFHPVGRSIQLNALWTGTRLAGPGGVVHGEAFQRPTPVLWAMQGGYGGPDTLHNDRGAAAALNIPVITTAGLATNRSEPRAAFYLLKGSYFADWNAFADNLMRALLATPQYGLASCWTMERIWQFDGLAVGDTLGSGFVRTARGAASTRTTYLLGDPTLRAVVTAPPIKANARARNENVELNWGASPDASDGYVVYRSLNGLDGPHERVTRDPLTFPRFTDERPPRGRKLYQVRALQRVVTGSGAFTNLSQAVFVTVN